jgi:hypothetical protein
MMLLKLVAILRAARELRQGQDDPARRRLPCNQPPLWLNFSAFIAPMSLGFFAQAAEKFD